MVKQSLKKFIKKYPYFLTREPSSIFYRTSIVNNKQIQQLYCDLFDVYQSFHLEKKILIWKTQTEPYNYTIHFVSNHYDIKHIEIYKNDTLIKEATFDKEGVSNFEWDYTATYVHSNIYKLQAYKCSECDTIYFDDEIPSECSCGNNEYIPLSVYKCSECGEIYFIDALDETLNTSDCTRNNHLNSLEQVNIYKCRNCGEIYFENEMFEECPNCYVEEYTNLGEFLVYGVENEIFTSDYTDVATVSIIDPVTEELVDTVVLSSENRWKAYTTPLQLYDLGGELIKYTLETDNPNYKVYIGDYVEHHTPSKTHITPPIYENDDSTLLIDNSENIETNFEFDFLSYEDYLYLRNHGHIHIVGRRTQLADGEGLQVIDRDTSIITNPSDINTFDVDVVRVYDDPNIDDEVVETITLTPLRLTDEGDIIITPFDKWETPSEPTWEAYTEELPILDKNGEPISYRLMYDNDNFNVQIIDHTPLSHDFTLTYEEIIKQNNGFVTEENVDDSGEPLLLEIPMIPTDKFRMVVTTYEEYKIEKGFPENDYTQLEYNRGLADKIIEPNVYDHDYSLDELGALNNIPRKQYEFITEPLLYPYTEPTYNNRTTEDDYHYMKRMIEYNTRIWWMNPVSLELWKMYGIESELINRERYLIKVFDEQRHPFNEETELVECWSPLAWEHKDRFCDGTKSLGEYFFVYPSTVRPIVDEDITCEFHIMNMLGEDLPYNDYSISIDKLITEADKQTDIQRGEYGLEPLYIGYEVGDVYPLVRNYHDNKYIIESDYLSSEDDPYTDQATNIFTFKCYKADGEQVGYDSKKSLEYNEKYNRTYIVVNVRDYDDSDWFVNPKPSNYLDNEGEVIEGYVGKGTEEEPFLTLEEAISRVTPGLNLIGLGDNITLTSPVVVDKTCTIIGKDKEVPTGNYTVEGEELLKRQVPRIFQHNVVKVDDTLMYNRRFFNVTGGKTNKLTLSNLRLVSGEINNYVNINSWMNTNEDEASVLTVYVHGGGVLMTITFDENDYYPYDFVGGTLKLTKSDGETPLQDNTVQIYYKSELVQSYTTDSNGEFHFIFNLQEFVQGEYRVVFKNKSSVFFESEISEILDATKPFTDKVYLYQGERIDLTSENHDTSTEEEVNYYTNIHGLINTQSLDNTGTSVFDYNPIFGRYIVYTTVNNEINGRVREEWYIEGKTDIDTLYDYIQDVHNTGQLITDLVFNEVTGIFNYAYVDLEALLEENGSLKLSDFENVVTDVYMDGDEIVIEKFHTPLLMSEDTTISYSDAKELEKALISISLDNNGTLNFTRIGEFWRRRESSMSLTSSATTFEAETELTISGSIISEEANEEINVFIDGEYITTLLTNSSGEFTYTNNTLNVGEHTIKCVWNGNGTYDSCEAEETVTVLHNMHITLATSSNEVIVSDNFILTGQVSRGGTGLSDKSVEIYDGNQLLTSEPLTTDNNGEYELTIPTTLTPRTYSLYSKLIDEEYDNIISTPRVSVVVRRLNTNITMNCSNSIYYSQSVTVTGKLTDENNTNMSGVSVKLFENGYLRETTTTNNNGEYTFPSRQYTSTDTYTLMVKYEGDDYHNNTSTSKQLTVNKAPTSTSLGINKETYKYGEVIPISVTSSYGSFNPSSVTVHYWKQGQFSSEMTEVLTTKNGNGEFEFTIPSELNLGGSNLADGVHEIYAQYTGSDNYNQSSSSTQTITVENDLFTDITLSFINGRTFRVNFKKNGVNVTNALIPSLKIVHTSGMLQGGFWEFTNSTTNSSGNIEKTVNNITSFFGHGSCYAEVGEIQSNSIDY